MADDGFEAPPMQPSEVTISDLRIALAELRADISRLGEDLAEFAENQKSAVESYAADIENRIRQRPLAAVAIAFVAGRLLSFRWAARLAIAGYLANRLVQAAPGSRGGLELPLYEG
jgi:hypothetical protein